MSWVISAHVLSGQHRVAAEAAVVPPEMVDVVMETPALLAAPGASDDQVRDEADVPELHQVRVEAVPLVVPLGLVAQHRDHGGGPREALIAPDDAHIVP